MGVGNSVVIIKKMISPKITCLLLLGVLMITSVNSTIAQASENPYCGAADTLNMAVTSPTIDAYDFVGNYYDPETDNTANLFIKYGSDTDNFMFITYDDKLEVIINVDCDQTINMTFVGLFENLLVLQQSVTLKYFGCIYDPAADGSTVPRI